VLKRKKREYYKERKENIVKREKVYYISYVSNKKYE